MPGAERSHAVLRERLLRHGQLRGPGHRPRGAVRLPPRGAVPADLPRAAQPGRRLVLPGGVHGAGLHPGHRQRHGALRRFHRGVGHRAQRFGHHRPAGDPAGCAGHPHRVGRHRHLGDPDVAGRHPRQPAAGPLPGLRGPRHRAVPGRDHDRYEPGRQRADCGDGVRLHREGGRHGGEPVRGVPRGHRDDHHRLDDAAAGRCGVHGRLQGDQRVVRRLPGGHPGHQHGCGCAERVDAELHLRRRSEGRQRVERDVRPDRAEGHGDQPLLRAHPPGGRHRRSGLHGDVLRRQRGADRLRGERGRLHIAPPGR
ncbi:hypothetical protein SCOCK_260050 [Actinacidiphila cocklensis]|uniref:Uncharacterized protein n=1 Tax=Actinacidiphila cocklensis TaxID=887465 RepID=A0A9W4E749_9ACTN|nr:hypothetical protein SCOCK_260050 [Actinacidiphila cocklensis]